MGNTLVSLPLCALTRSKLNVRKTDRYQDIEHLAASVASKGLLENLVVRPIDGETYEVIAGGRRLAALKLLARRTIPDDHPVSRDTRTFVEQRNKDFTIDKHRQP